MTRKIIASVLIAVLSLSAYGQTTEFTYQGMLSTGTPAQPANGNHDFGLLLYDSPDLGSVVAFATYTNVPVVNGIYTLTPNFGNVWNGSGRWLEVQVRPSGTQNWTVLMPRQLFRSAPYAIRSLDSATVGGIAPSGLIRNTTVQQASSNFNISGNGVIGNRLGIGTNAPAEALQVAGNAIVNAGLTVGGSGFVLGQLGVGTSFPSSKLHVSGVGIVRAKINSDSNGGVQLTLNEQPGWSVATANGGHFQIFNDAVIQNAFWIDRTNNNVGIGTTAPLQTLHVHGSEILSTGPGAGFKFRARGQNTAFDDWVWFAEGPAPNESASLWKNGTTLLQIFPNGTMRIPSLATGGSQVGLCALFNGNVGWCSSSIQYKKNLADFRSGIDLFRRLRPVSFDWKESNARDLGLVAEEVAEIEPLLVTRTADGEVMGVKYDRLGVVAINAIKEQQAQIERQQQQIEALTKLVCSLKPHASMCNQNKR